MQVDIKQLVTYPIKSCAGIKHQSIEVDAWGLKHDRQWMIVDQNQLFLSQRKYPQMALIRPSFNGEQLHLKAPGMDDCVVQMNSNRHVDVTVWKDSLSARTADDNTNDWLSQYLNSTCTLVQFDQTSHRAVDPEFSQAGDQVKFADGYPLLITHQATLDSFNHQQEHVIPMDRFRPNIVVESTQDALAELSWQALKHQNLVIELPKPCARCVMTGVNHELGVSEGGEVYKRLKQEFSHQNKATFGMNGIARTAANKAVTLSLGMTLTIQNK